MKGQLSAEMLIIVVVILAIVGIAASQLMGTAKETGATIDNQTDRINRLAAESLKSDSGEACINDDDCLQGLSCDENFLCN